MKAIVRHRYGASDVLELANLPKPSPGEGEVLIRVRAAGLNPFDWHMMRGMPWPLRLVAGVCKPKRIGLGVDVAGTVVGLGQGVTEFRLGDEVFGAADGALAEYVCAPASGLVGRPSIVSCGAAAAVPIAGLTALQGLRDKGHVTPGARVLVNGAAGGVGTFAVQIAKWQGVHVSGVCSTRNVEMVRSIGADRVIDYTREDFAAGVERYDVIFELVGNRTLADFRRVLKPDGVFIGCGGGGPEKSTAEFFSGMLNQMVTGWFTKQRLVGFIAKRSNADLEILRELLANGLVKPVIDRTYSLAEVPDAMRYLEEGHARGKVVVQV
ncbi:NAD(P)-dependent alcohol dehydrogenase [Occallatibacter savannae]|uniref:NAD(P)-dependent alcohol dehydrogenase n=1 Tax=Occallatibacter savannae TaxID=1002691 RepID=UPI000D69B7FE|nr:NAD(P)-dependent alcohol dehydrogenase [Occallatibacter savannae]